MFPDPKFDCTALEFRRFFEHALESFVADAYRLSPYGERRPRERRLSHAEWLERFEAWMATEVAQARMTQYFKTWAVSQGLLESKAGR